MPKKSLNQYQTIFNAFPEPGFDTYTPPNPTGDLTANPHLTSSFLSSDWSSFVSTPASSSEKLTEPESLLSSPQAEPGFAEPHMTQELGPVHSTFETEPPPSTLMSPITFFDQTNNYLDASDTEVTDYNLLGLTGVSLATRADDSGFSVNQLTPALTATSSDLSPLQSPAQLQFLFVNSPSLSDNALAWSPDKTEPLLYTRQRAPKVSKTQLILKTLNSLRKSNLSILDVLLYMLDNAGVELGSFVTSFMNSDKLSQLLDRVWTHKKGKLVLEEWMESRAVDMVCEKVSSEMELAKPEVRMSSSDVTLDYLRNWDINAIVGPISQKITPTWTKILLAATESKKSLDTDRPRAQSRNLITAQVHFIRSQDSAKAQLGLGLMLASSGTSRQVINVLHRSGFTVSFNTLSILLHSLAKQAVAHARTIARGPICVTYDNINMSGSIYAEQTFSTMSKVQSGSFAIIYEPRNLSPDVYNPAPLRQRLLSSTPLQLKDLQPSNASLTAYATQMTVNICHVLLKYANEFASYQYKDSLILKNVSRRQHPAGYKTKFHTLRATTIEEASITGNILVHEDIFVTQLQKTVDELNKFAVPSINDQLTNSRIRSVQAIRKRDMNYWHRRDILQVAFAPFHMIMNLNNALLHIHRGHESQLGSLSSLFSVLGKVRLNGDRPDYHTLLMAFMEILDGFLLNAWRRECGFPSLKEFASSNPTPEKLISVAQVIAAKYAMPTVPIKPLEKLPRDSKKGNNELRAPQEDTSSPSEIDDSICENLRRLTRDLLIVKEVTRAVAAGDFGRIEDLLSQLACIFRGAGSNNYSTEILHFIFNLKHVWTTDFANVMRDMMIVNVSGKEGHAMGIDMNIEHMIRSLKTIFASKGIYANWDRLGDISAVISHLSIIKKQVVETTRSNYQGSTHSPSDINSLVWMIANHARDNRLQEAVSNRSAETSCMLVPDLAMVGMNKFASASLETFNEKIRGLSDGVEVEDEQDEIPVVTIPIIEDD